MRLATCKRPREAPQVTDLDCRLPFFYYQIPYDAPQVRILWHLILDNL
jgi:hypothetical protein